MLSMGSLLSASLLHLFGAASGQGLVFRVWSSAKQGDPVESHSLEDPRMGGSW